MLKLIAVAFAAVAALTPAPEAAAQTQVVALGASNTYGRGGAKNPGGVEPSQAYPAQLQAMLKAQGVNARVRNAGVPGDTTGGMLARLSSAVPAGTRVVILQPGGNDARRGISPGQRAANIAEMQRRLAALGAQVIVLERILSLVPAASRHADGQHFDARGHAAVAAHLLPQVIAALGRR